MYYQKGTGTITVSATGRVQRDHTTQLYTTHGGGTADGPQVLHHFRLGN